MTPWIVTPLGPISLVEEAGTLVDLRWDKAGGPVSPLIVEALSQLAAYFDGRLTRFDLPIALASGLVGQVQQKMLTIPLGETRTYGQIARALGVPAQAIGQACGANPLPIIVPCHRVLGATSLGGFSAPGGVESKVWLLRHEGAAGLLL